MGNRTTNLAKSKLKSPLAYNLFWPSSSCGLVLDTPESSKQHNTLCISNTVDAIHLEMENDALDLGTEFEFGLTELSDNRERYTVAQLITALEATTTLTELTVFGHRPFPDDIYAPRPPSNVQVVEPLCR